MNDKLNLFFEYLTVELGVASNTRLAYERDLRLFKEALGLKDNDALATVSREQVIRYMTGLKNKGLAAATIARKLAAIKSFYRFMTAEGYLELGSCGSCGSWNKRYQAAKSFKSGRGFEAFGTA